MQECSKIKQQQKWVGGDIEWKHWQGKWRILHIDKQTSEWTNCFIERLTKFINLPLVAFTSSCEQKYTALCKSLQVHSFFWSRINIYINN